MLRIVITSILLALLLSVQCQTEPINTDTVKIESQSKITDIDTVKITWYSWSPYQYINNEGDLTGLDYDLIKALFSNRGITTIFDNNTNRTWTGNQTRVEQGYFDATGGAVSTEVRQQKYHMSDKYRFEVNKLYVRTSDKELQKLKTVDEIIAFAVKNKSKVGAIDSYVYCDEKINKFIKENSSLIVKAEHDEQLFENFKNGDTRFVISDRLVGAKIIWEKKLGDEFMEHSSDMDKKGIHLLIHKDPDPVKDSIYQLILAEFNASIIELEESGELDILISEDLFPVLMHITVQTKWFSVIDLIGIIFFAFTGLMIAYDNKFDIFGVVIMCLLLGAGGGIIRDLIVGRPLAFIQDPRIINSILQIAVIGFVFLRIHDWLRRKSNQYNRFSDKHNNKLTFVRVAIEAMALGAYTIVGVGVAVEMRLEPLYIWGPILGCVTSCGGGIISSFLTKTKSVAAINGSLDPEISVLVGVFFSYVLIFQTKRLDPSEVFIGVISAMAISSVLLVIIYLRKWRSPKIRK
ncbi:MAG: TRIC cation channel family protein [Flavobacteriales bacterium]|nr:TRIC cation channel family protein [Flavobacteriales bacterium]